MFSMVSPDRIEKITFGKKRTSHGNHGNDLTSVRWGETKREETSIITRITQTRSNGEWKASDVTHEWTDDTVKYSTTGSTESRNPNTNQRYGQGRGRRYTH